MISVANRDIRKQDRSTAATDCDATAFASIAADRERSRKSSSRNRSHWLSAERVQWRAERHCRVLLGESYVVTHRLCPGRLGLSRHSGARTKIRATSPRKIADDFARIRRSHRPPLKTKRKAPDEIFAPVGLSALSFHLLAAANWCAQYRRWDLNPHNLAITGF